MKKHYLMFAAAATMLAACAETDVINDVNEKDSASQAIGFETFADKMTREGEGTTNLHTHHTYFSVWASKKLTENTYSDVYGTESCGTVSYDENNTKWTASPLKFWDKAALNYYFYAAAPVDAEWVLNSTVGVTNDVNTVGTNGSFRLTDFTLSGTNLATAGSELVGTWINKENGDRDLMVATLVSVDSDKFSESEPDKVDFTFRHILSKLNIKVKGKDLSGLGATITLNNLNVCGLNNKANYTESSENTCDWANHSVEGTYTLKGGFGNNAGSLNLTTTSVYTHEYLVIPQTVDYVASSFNIGTEPDEGAYLFIKYTVSTGSGNELSKEEFQSYYNLANVFGDTNNLTFEEGGQYTLSVSIAPDVIEFETQETKWEENDEQNQTPDINIE